jgi:hypothetical protein
VDDLTIKQLALAALASVLWSIDMPNYAIIENGKVVNTVVAEADYAATQGWVELTGTAGVNWDYTNGQFVDNRPVPEVVTPPAPTKEELLAQLNALSAQIQALE